MNLGLSRNSVVSVLAITSVTVAIPKIANAQSVKSTGQSLIKLTLLKGFVTLYVNGQDIGKIGRLSADSRTGNAVNSVPIDQYVKPGLNTLKIVWAGEKSPVGGVTVSYAPPGAAMRLLTDVRLTPVNAKPSGSRNVTFSLPKSGTNESVAADASAVSDVAPGSHANQTLLVASIVNDSTTNVFVNGKQVGSFAGGNLPLDVSDYVKYGLNNIKLTWEGKPPYGEIRVSHAVEPSNFRKLISLSLNPVTVKRGTKSRTVSFNLPKPK